MAENQILVIRGGAIGDFILTLPVLAALRRQFPSTRLEVLGYPHIAQLAVAGGLAEAAQPIEARAMAGFFAKDGLLDSSLQEYFNRFAIILSYLYDPDGIFQANIARCAKGRFIAGPHRPGDAAGRAASELLLEPLQRLAIFEANAVPRLVLSSAPPPGHGSGSTRPLAIHPGSGSERKNWPEPRWGELLEHLAAATARPFLILGGEVESGRLQRLAQRLPAGRGVVFESRPLVEVARSLQACAGFVGHDSGITHLAAALGLPTLVLWGPAPAAVWAPRGPNVTVLETPGGIASLPVAAVLDALRRLGGDDSV